MGSGRGPDGLDTAVSARGSWRGIAAHADSAKADAVGIDVWSRLQIIAEIRHEPFGIRGHVQTLDPLRRALPG